MSTNTKTVHRATAVLSPPKSVSMLITHARSVVTRMTGNALFPAPVPALAAITTAVEDLEVAENRHGRGRPRRTRWAPRTARRDPIGPVLDRAAVSCASAPRANARSGRRSRSRAHCHADPPHLDASGGGLPS